MAGLSNVQPAFEEALQQLWDTGLAGCIWRGVLACRKKDGGSYDVEVCHEQQLIERYNQLRSELEEENKGR